MMKNNDKLLQEFFAENRHEIEDNGFSLRVMRRLPDRTQRLSQIWTAFCFALALVLFYVLDGWKLILDVLREMFTAAAQHSLTQVDTTSLLVAAGVLLFFIYRKICSLA